MADLAVQFFLFLFQKTRMGQFVLQRGVQQPLQDSMRKLEAFRISSPSVYPEREKATHKWEGRLAVMSRD